MELTENKEIKSNQTKFETYSSMYGPSNAIGIMSLEAQIESQWNEALKQAETRKNGKKKKIGFWPVLPLSKF